MTGSEPKLDYVHVSGCDGQCPLCGQPRQRFSWAIEHPTLGPVACGRTLFCESCQHRESKTEAVN